MLQSETEYQVRVPKETIKSNDDDFDIFWEYYTASYIGQKLFEIATCFSYFVPSVYLREDFWFDLTILDAEKFADLLYYIISGYYENDFNTSILVNDDASKFYMEAFDNEDLLVGCWVLIEIANRHLAEKPDNSP